MRPKPPTPEMVFDALWDEQWLLNNSIIDFPVSKLQRRFLLGYHRTVALVDELENRGLIRRLNKTTIQVLLTHGRDSSHEANNA